MQNTIKIFMKLQKITLSETSLSEQEIKEILSDTYEGISEGYVGLTCVGLISACKESCKDSCKDTSKAGRDCSEGCLPACKDGCKGSQKQKN